MCPYMYSPAIRKIRAWTVTGSNFSQDIRKVSFNGMLGYVITPADYTVSLVTDEGVVFVNVNVTRNLEGKLACPFGNSGR